MASELHLSESMPFGQTSRFGKGVSFQALTEISDENRDFNGVALNGNNQMPAQMLVTAGTATVISKSSSSDSDTNDSATRLLEDSLQDFRSVRYLLLSPPATHTTTCLNENPSNNSDVLWTQMQNSLSKEIRNRYLTKTRFGTTIRRDYTFVGLHCYSSAVKLVLIVTLCVLICTFILLMTVLFVWRHNQFSPDNSDRSDISNKNWWRGSTFYEIFVASFKDSDGDGFGDLIGLKHQILYLKELGINAIRLNSIFSAFDYPHRYDNVLDFFTIDPHIGKWSDFHQLVKALHESNIYIILDINLVSTSDQHPWAAQWMVNKSGEHQYFYVNVSGDQINDEDWTSSSATDRLQTDFVNKDSHFGGRLHLNWSDPMVRNKMLEVFDFWLQYIDGFYLKRLEELHIDSEVTLYDILKEFRVRANKMSGRGVGVSATKILICSSNFVQKRHKLLLNYMRHPLDTNDLRMSTTANNSTKIVDINGYFDLIDFQIDININKTETIRDQVNAIFLNSQHTPWIHWSLGDVERSRLSTRIGIQYSLTASFLLIMLPGTISILYGDEIGLQDSYDRVLQKEYRGGQLCPMQWNSNLNANFSESNTTKPWLPIHPNYIRINVLKQNESIKRFNQLTAFRADNFDVQELGKHGNYLFHYIDDNLIVFERYFDRGGNPPELRFRYVLFANFGPKTKVKDFSDKFHFSRIKISSSAKRQTEFLYMKSLRLDSGEAMIVEVE